MKNIVNRLRGIYVVPIEDGGGPIDGSMEFKREFPTLPIQLEAADYIEKLETLVWMGWRELNEIRARDGVPRDFHGHKAGVSEEYFSEVVECMSNALGDKAVPWMQTYMEEKRKEMAKDAYEKNK